MRHHAKCCADRSNRCRDIAIVGFFRMAAAADIWRFFIFLNGGSCHLGFRKLQIFNGQKRQECRTTSPRQISLRSVKRYRDIEISKLFKMPAVAILDFKHFKFSTVGTVQRVELRNCAKLRRNRSYRGRYMVSFLFFQDGCRRPSWICDACVETTHEEHLVVFVALQNLVGIDAVVLIICMFFNIASLAWKRLFKPKSCFWERFDCLNGEQSEKNKKTHPCASSRRLSYHAWKSVDGSDL